MSSSVDDDATVRSRMLEADCPGCGESKLWRVEKAVSEFRKIKTPSGYETLEATVEFRECRHCGWRSPK